MFGAGGNGVGTKTLELTLAGHHSMITVVHNPQVTTGLQEKGVQVFIDNACDNQATAYACRVAGRHVTMISSMGGAQDYLVHRTVINEAEEAETKHMILAIFLGCGDSWLSSSLRVRAAFGQAVWEKLLAESWLQTSLLDYAILRPGGLLNDGATGLAQHMQAEECHGFVMHADAVWYIHELATVPALNDQIYSLVEPGLKPAQTPRGAETSCRKDIMERCVLKDSPSSVSILTGLFLSLVVLMLFGTSQGALNTSFSALLNDEYRDIWLNTRLPRVLLAVLTGIVLAMAGVIVQELFHNPMADPGLLSVSSGSALMVGTVIVIPFSSSIVLVLYGQVTLAVAGSMVTCTTIFLISQRHNHGGMMQLLLAGIVINALCGSAIGMLNYVDDEQQLRQFTLWMIGNLDQAQWPALLVANTFVLPAIAVTVCMAGTLNLLQLGDEEAHYLGVNVKHKYQQLLLLSSLLVGAVVPVSGVISLIGLVILYLIRMTTGADHRWVIPCSTSAGAYLLPIADILTRTLVQPAEIPVGLLTNLISEPYFLWLILRSQRVS